MWEQIERKVQTWMQIEQTAAQWKKEGQQIVFTNGCFDILHYGHVHYLADAKSLGSKLIVGINSDASVKRLKGRHRPINDNLTRKFLLASLACVDAVVEFEQDTPLDLISLLLPDFLVKGGDWQPKDIVGSDIVMKQGGIVKSLPFVQGYSTSNIEQKILSRGK